METETDLLSALDTTGHFEARYIEFLDTITHLRPKLHGYCARMTGLVLDGEEVMQEAVFEAYRKLESYDDSRALRPWLFRIVHNRCIDYLRRRRVREEAEYQWTPPGRAGPTIQFHFCKICGIRTPGSGDLEVMGGVFYAVQFPLARRRRS